MSVCYFIKLYIILDRRRNFVQGFVGPLNFSFNYEQKKGEEVIGEKGARGEKIGDFELVGSQLAEC